MKSTKTEQELRAEIERLLDRERTLVAALARAAFFFDTTQLMLEGETPNRAPLLTKTMQSIVAQCHAALKGTR